MFTGKQIVGAVVIGGMLLVGAWALIESSVTISQGHVGVVFSKNGGVIHETVPQGHQWVNPISKVIEYPVSLDTVKYADGMSLPNKDGKPLTITFEYDYMNDVEKIPYIFDKFKGQTSTDIENNFLRSRLKEAASEVTSQYTILEIFQKYEEVKNQIDEAFTASVKLHGFIIDNFVLGTPQPDEKTQAAIQKVVDAQQELEALKIETLKEKEKAAKAKIIAQGNADAKIIEAQGQAKANLILQNSITDKLLKKMEMEARQKHGWVTITGSSTAVVSEK